MYALDFEYDKQNLSDFGFIICNFDDDQGATYTDIGSNITFITTPAWLLSQGFFTESKEPTTINRTIRRPSNRSSEIGIQEQEFVDPKTGELKKQMVLTLQAQAYLLAHLDDIAACQQ